MLALAAAWWANADLSKVVDEQILIARLVLRDLEHAIDDGAFDAFADAFVRASALRPNADACTFHEVHVAARKLLDDEARPLTLSTAIVCACFGAEKEDEREGRAAKAQCSNRL